MTLRPLRFATIGTNIVAALLAATLAAAPVIVFAVDNDAQEDRAELRVKDMHKRLAIQPAQEAQWKVVATIMRDNAVTMDKLTQLRVDHAGEVSAVEDLKSYGDISDAHAQGIKKLTPAFSALYAAMSDSQKKQADLLFRQGAQAQGGNEVATQPAATK